MAKSRGVFQPHPATAPMPASWMSLAFESEPARITPAGKRAADGAPVGSDDGAAQLVSSATASARETTVAFIGEGVSFSGVAEPWLSGIWRLTWLAKAPDGVHWPEQVNSDNKPMLRIKIQCMVWRLRENNDGDRPQG